VSTTVSLRRDGDALRVSGPLTMATVAAAVEPGRAALAAGVRRVDLSQVAEVDSAAIALLLEWFKRAGAPLVIDSAPEPLRKLARLYAMHDLLPFAGAASAAEGTPRGA